MDDEGREVFERGLFLLISWIFFFAIGFGIGHYIYKDNKFDLNPLSIDKGIFGINIHKAGDNSTLVDGWSYGCQVLAKSIDFNALMRLVERSASIYGNSFTYTLINEDDL